MIITTFTQFPKQLQVLQDKIAFQKMTLHAYAAYFPQHTLTISTIRISNEFEIAAPHGSQSRRRI